MQSLLGQGCVSMSVAPWKQTAKRRIIETITACAFDQDHILTLYETIKCE